MFKSFRVGSLFGIPLKLDVTLLIVLPLFTWLIAAQITEIIEVINVMLGTTVAPEPLAEGVMPWVLGLLAAVGLFVGVALHELGHSLVAIRYDYEIDSITLWLLGGLAQFTEQPREWNHEFWIAIAGPAVSVAVGAVCYAAVVVLPSGFDALIFLFGYLAVLNVVLAVFNMIPAFPLDGGRVLRALFTRSQPFAQATQRAVQIGKLFAIMLGLFGLLAFNIFMIAIAFFVYIAGSAEGRHTLIASVFEDVPVQDVMTPANELVTVSTELPVTELLDRMMEQRHSGYPVVKDGDVVGIVTIEDVQGIPSERRMEYTVGDVMSDDLQTLSEDSTAMEAFTEIARHDFGRLLITDNRGDVVGLITRTDLMRAFAILQQRKLVTAGRHDPIPTQR